MVVITLRHHTVLQAHTANAPEEKGEHQSDTHKAKESKL